MIDLLRDLEAELARLAPPVVAALRPGLAAKEIDELLSVLPQPVPEDVRALFEWHDGTEQVHGAYRAELFTFGTMTPLAEAVNLWKVVVEDTSGDWNPRWLPLFGEEYGLFHAVACGPDGGAVALLPYLDLPDIHVEYPTLRAFIQSILRRWRSGVYRLSSHASVDTDDRALAAIRRDEDGADPDVAALVRDLTRGDEDAFSNASYRLGSRLYPAAVPDLIAVLHDSTGSARPKAAELLGRIGGPQAAAALAKTATGDPDEYMRRLASVALRKLESETGT